MTSSDLYQIEKDAFLAGLFDADGCVSIYNSLKKKSNKVYTVHTCEISMTNEEVINWIKDTVGFLLCCGWLWWGCGCGVVYCLVWCLGVGSAYLITTHINRS
jgi:hypothetical protein